MLLLNKEPILCKLKTVQVVSNTRNTRADVQTGA